MDQLDQQRERIQEDLRGLIAGDVRLDDVFLQLYAADGSIYETRPLGVVRPRSTADVIACVQYAAAQQIPIHARGAGTGTAGASLGSGLVIDFSRHLRRIIQIDADVVRVQPGANCQRLRTLLGRMNRTFGPDPITANITTIGGMIGVDAAGSRSLKFGSTRDSLRSLQVVLADGELLEVGREPLVRPAISGYASTDTNPRKRDLINRLAKVLAENADLIRRKQPSRLSSWCGYGLGDVLEEDHLDLARLLAGSEGTLALTTEATLAIGSPPPQREVTLLLFNSLDKAARAVVEVLAFEPVACDLMDRRHLSLARERDVCFDLLIPPETEAALLVEQEDEDPIQLRGRVWRLIDALWHTKRLAFCVREAQDQTETELFWQLASTTQSASYSIKSRSRPVPVVEDITVLPEVLPDFLLRMQNVLKRCELTASLFCHAGEGRMRIQPFLDLGNPADVQRMRRLAEGLYREVLDVGGVIGGERGCGLSRTSFVREQAGQLYDVFRKVKRMFDPRDTLNPGKIVSDDPHLLTRHLRPPIPYSASESNPPDDETDAPGLRDLVELQLNWDPSDVSEATARCNRCGHCRTQSADSRMCPIFRFRPAEESSPRAKVNLIAGVLTDAIDLSTLTGEQFKAVADLCVHCQMCGMECPARVDVARLMTEGKGAYVRANGLSPTDWLMTRLELLSAFGGMFRSVANWSIGNRQMRWFMEKTLGIAQGRKLPRVASPSFLRRAARRKLTRRRRRRGQRVAYFVDTYANYHDPQLAEAVVAVLKHNDVAVYVPARQKPAGMPSIAAGALDHARRLAQQNVRVLTEPVRQGYHVVTAEPTAALCLSREYPKLVDDDDSRLVAENVSEICTFLWRLHTEGHLKLDFQPIEATLAYHMPCHLKALEVGSPGENLLGLIPQLAVQRIEAGCSGMAGTYGLQRKNYRNSLRAGWGLITRLRDSNVEAGVTECSACKIQMEQGTDKPTIHPIKLLALSYGLMPELAELLQTPSGKLTIS